MSDGEKARARRVRPYALAAMALLGVLVGRALLEGGAAMRRSDALLEQGDVDGAIAQALRASRWYVPFASTPRAGYDRMREIALHAELASDVDTALVAWEAIRAAARSTRTLWQPFEERLAEADEHIAAILAAKPLAAAERGKSREERVLDQRRALAEDDGPRPLAIVALYVGLAAWLWGAFRALGAVDEALGEKTAIGRFSGDRARRLVVGSALAVAGMLVYLVGLSKA